MKLKTNKILIKNKLEIKGIRTKLKKIIYDKLQVRVDQLVRPWICSLIVTSLSHIRVTRGLYDR
jgi:hypothetical protein